MRKIKVNSKKKLLIAVNLFLIFTLMTVSVYAWFASQVDNRVDAYEIQVESDNALELSFDKVTWGGTLNLADYKSGGNLVLDTMKFVEVTSDGETFRIPQLTQKNNYAEVNTSGDWTDAMANKDYLEFTVHMRSKDALDVYLSSDSKAAPASSVVTGADCGNPSSYASGDNAFSKDCVVGALRVSYLDSSNTRRIWITNPNFHLENTVGSSDYSMKTDATDSAYTDLTEGTPFEWNNPYHHYYYNTSNALVEQTTDVIVALPDTISSVPTETSTKLTSLSGTKDANDYYNASVTFRVWIEGCDTEARRALVDGKFNLSLVFDTFGIS